MEHDNNQLAADIERERREIANLQERVKQLVSRNEGPRKEKRDDEIKKLRHHIDVTGNITRAAP